MLVSCLMPTYNRPPNLWLLEEAVECFIRQDYPDKELIICNDTPGQRLVSYHPQVKVFNLPYRFKNLSDKIQYMISNSQGEVLCRWDDDDISLPHRLSCSVARLGDQLEWHADNYFYDPGSLIPVDLPGNTHIMAIWRRAVLDVIGGYPSGVSGIEDQAFNAALIKKKIHNHHKLPLEDIYYIYRRSLGVHHLSGRYCGPDNDPHEGCYIEIGKYPIVTGEFVIQPRWRENYIARVWQKLRMLKIDEPPVDPQSFRNHFNYAQLYNEMVYKVPHDSLMVEVGCYKGTSLCYLANRVRTSGKRIHVIGVDLGIGANDHGRVEDLFQDYAEINDLLTNVRAAHCQDLVSVIVGESTRAARMFADASIDFLFLDPSHDYHSVKSDLQAWVRKVKPGGYAAGHDYIGGWPGVQKAVDEYFNATPFSLSSPYARHCWMKHAG